MEKNREQCREIDKEFKKKSYQALLEISVVVL